MAAYRSIGDIEKAEGCFRKAIQVATRQKARGFELRAATSLATLWQSQGKRDEARELLSPIYDWFTEGFDTPDMIDTKALLDELGWRASRSWPALAGHVNLIGK